ncbi:MAG TPA: sulfide:quinone reductase [Epsilonproteobacteria bacterium]|nr:sulfide:quinone reductase [Campylobacterota bacterium]
MANALVLGGGFAGVEAAIYLRKHNIDVTLVSNRDYFYIYPTSIWIPTGEATMKDVSVPLADLAKAHGFKLVIDEVREIRSREHRALCADGEYSADYLIIAMGSGKMKHKGDEHFLSICGKPEEAPQIKDRIDALIEKGSGKIAMGFGGNPKDPSNVRGGPAFEVIFNLHNRLKKLGIRDQFELTFFAPMEKPGARMGPQALKMMDIYFGKLGIKKHFGKKIIRFEENGVVFEDESKLESDFTMFIPAGNGHPVFENSDLPLNEAGLIKINDYCEVMHDFDDTPERYNVFAIGDSTALDGPDWRAKQGHIAEVMARNIAFNIDAMIKGKEERKGYLEHINILCVMDSGDGAAFVYRSSKGGKMIPMPIVGHWMKKGWGWYCRNSKLGKIPRLPGM